MSSVDIRKASTGFVLTEANRESLAHVSKYPIEISLGNMNGSTGKRISGQNVEVVNPYSGHVLEEIA